jgi:hypothetical protein
MKNIAKLITTFFLLTYATLSCAWWDGGHMVVANIAYQYLTPKAKAKVLDLLPNMACENTSRRQYDFNRNHPNYTFMAMSHWADDIKTYPNFLNTMSTWHYIEDGYSNDGTPYPTPPRDNVVWAIKTLKRVLYSTKANPYVKTRTLAFVVHFIGDIHQPLHTAELYSSQFHHGDRGGNQYNISYMELDGYEIRNLHKLWDSALNLFPQLGYRYNVSLPEDIDALSYKIMQDVPLESVKKQVKDLEPKHWQQESHALAIKAHEVELGGTPSQVYMDENTKAVEKQLAIAGYRLAEFLNRAFNK